MSRLALAAILFVVSVCLFAAAAAAAARDPCRAKVWVDLATWAGQADRGELDAREIAVLIRGCVAVCAPRETP